MITELTNGQWQEIYVLREEYRAAGLCTDPADRPTTERLIARFYERIGKPTQAEAIYRKALLIDPQYAELRLRLGRLLLQRGAHAEARDQAARALRVQPNRQALLDLLDAAGTPLVEDAQ